jgi:hypothetical protein
MPTFTGLSPKRALRACVTSVSYVRPVIGESWEVGPIDDTR